MPWKTNHRVGEAHSYKAGMKLQITSLPEGWTNPPHPVGNIITLDDPPCRMKDGELVLLHSRCYFLPAEHAVPVAPWGEPFRASMKLRVEGLPNTVTRLKPRDKNLGSYLENGDIITVMEPVISYKKADGCWTVAYEDCTTTPSWIDIDFVVACSDGPEKSIIQVRPPVACPSETLPSKIAASDRSSYKAGDKVEVIALPKGKSWVYKWRECETLKNGTILTLADPPTGDKKMSCRTGETSHSFYLYFVPENMEKLVQMEWAWIPVEWVLPLPSSTSELRSRAGYARVACGHTQGGEINKPTRDSAGATPKGKEVMMSDRKEFQVGTKCQISNIPANDTGYANWGIKNGDDIIVTGSDTKREWLYFRKNGGTFSIPMNWVSPSATSIPDRKAVDRSWFKPGDRFKVVALPDGQTWGSPWDDVNLANGHTITLSDPPTQEKISKYNFYTKEDFFLAFTIVRVGGLSSYSFIPLEWVERLDPLVRECRCPEDTLFNTRGICVCGAAGPAITEESLYDQTHLDKKGYPSDADPGIMVTRPDRCMDPNSGD
jgi:hypothetical protein